MQLSLKLKKKVFYKTIYDQLGAKTWKKKSKFQKYKW